MRWYSQDPSSYPQTWSCTLAIDQAGWDKKFPLYVKQQILSLPWAQQHLTSLPMAFICEAGAHKHWGCPWQTFQWNTFFPEISIQGILQEKFYLKTSECYMERVLLAVRGCAASPPSGTGGHKTGEVSSWQSLWLVLGITSEDAKINIICNCILDTLYNWQHSQIIMGVQRSGLRVPAVREREVCHIQTVHLRASSSSLITSFW